MIKIEFQKFRERIDFIVNELEHQKDFITLSLIDPALMFGAADKNLKSTNIPLFNIMSVYEDNERKMNVHEFQEFICSIVDKYFKEQFAAQPVDVRVRNANSFPSRFAVNYEGSEIIQFDIFEKFYGFKDMTSTEEVVKNEYTANKDAHEAEITRLKEKLETCKFGADNISKYIIDFHFKNVKENKNDIHKRIVWITKDFYEVIFHRKRLMESLDKLITKIEKQIETTQREFIRYNDLKSKIERIRFMCEAIKLIEPIFTQHGYKIQADRYRLF